MSTREIRHEVLINASPSDLIFSSSGTSLSGAIYTAATAIKMPDRLRR